MATKKDLLEAQSFSKARLLSAFVGGAPGGKELEPAKPMRAVFAGIALTAMVILAGVFIGLKQPSLPKDWQNNRLIVASDTGARYVSSDGTLHPVINTVSARMLIPEGEFAIVSVKQQSLQGIPIGGTVGILGAPDTLPKASSLDGTGWRACSTENLTDVRVGGQSRAAAPAKSGIVVESDGKTYVVSGGTSMYVPDRSRTAVLRAVGLETMTPVPVRGEWLALFARGADLAPIEVGGSGGTVAGVGLPAGSVVHPTGGSATDQYLLTADGKLAPLSPLAHRLYRLGTGADPGSGSAPLGEPVDLSPAQLAPLPTIARVAKDGWPDAELAPLADAAIPCATLSGPHGAQRTVLASGSGDSSESSEAATGAAKVTVAKDGGALVRGGSAGTLTLVDGGGTAYAIPGAVSTAAARLGYRAADVDVLPAAWIQLLPAGPALTPEAAGATPKGA